MLTVMKVSFSVYQGTCSQDWEKNFLLQRVLQFMFDLNKQNPQTKWRCIFADGRNILTHGFPMIILGLWHCGYEVRPGLWSSGSNTCSAVLFSLHALSPHFSGTGGTFLAPDVNKWKE